MLCEAGLRQKNPAGKLKDGLLTSWSITMTVVKNQSSKTMTTLHVAFELGWGNWKLAFATQPADNPRLRTLGARDRAAVLREIAAAKAKFRLPAQAPVVCCYEAGRDGYWLHRFL